MGLGIFWDSFLFQPMPWAKGKGNQLFPGCNKKRISPTLPSSYLNAGSWQFASPLPLTAGHNCAKGRGSFLYYRFTKKGTQILVIFKVSSKTFQSKNVAIYCIIRPSPPFPSFFSYQSKGGELLPFSLADQVTVGVSRGFQTFIFSTPRATIATQYPIDIPSISAAL